MRRPPHTNDAPHRVVIVGGGFGGLYAAKALRRAPVDVTLIDRSDHHLLQPLLHEVATGFLPEAEIARPLRGVLRRQRNTRVLIAEVTGFDLEARTVIAGDALEVEYDSLIVAAGATTADRGPADGSDRATALKSLADAREVRSRIRHALGMARMMRDPAWLRFAVVGGGPTGVELARRLSDIPSASVAVLEAGPELLPDFPEPQRRRAARDLRRAGIDVHLSTIAAVLDADGLELADGGRVEARTVLWAAGVSPSPLARRLADAAGSPVDATGRIIVAHDLTLPADPNVFAIGDMAAVDGMPSAVSAAMRQGRHAARQIQARPTRRRVIASHGSLKAPAYNAAVNI